MTRKTVGACLIAAPFAGAFGYLTASLHAATAAVFFMIILGSVVCVGAGIQLLRK